MKHYACCDVLIFLFGQGEKSFFLMPGEKLEKGIQNVYILGEDEGLILRARETFTDGVCISCYLLPVIHHFFDIHLPMSLMYMALK